MRVYECRDHVPSDLTPAEAETLSEHTDAQISLFLRMWIFAPDPGLEHRCNFDCTRGFWHGWRQGMSKSLSLGGDRSWGDSLR